MECHKSKFLGKKNPSGVRSELSHVARVRKGPRGYSVILPGPGKVLPRVTWREGQVWLGVILGLLINPGSYFETNLGPGILHRSVCTWTHLSSSNKIERNCRGLKITMCISSWGRLWT